MKEKKLHRKTNETILSILVPAYNEASTIAEIIEKIDKVNFNGKNISKDLIIVDDGSKDETNELARELEKKYPYVSLFNHDRNKGKGAAIKTALHYAKGDIIIFQDADLECDPQDYLQCILPILNGETSVVYGSRFLDDGFEVKYRLNRIVSMLLNYIVLLIYFNRLTDVTTCYKAFDASLIKGLKVKGNRFDFEFEITAKILKKGIKIAEVPIRYFPRTYKEGKKIRWSDAIHAFWTLLKYRLIN